MKHAIIMVCLLGLLGTVSVVAGIYLLAGIGWSMLALGILLFSGAAVLSRGISRG